MAEKTPFNWKLFAEVMIAVFGFVGAAFGLYVKLRTPPEAPAQLVQVPFLSILPVEGKTPHLEHNYCIAKARAVAAARGGKIRVDHDPMVEFTIGPDTVMIVCSETQFSAVSGNLDDDRVEDLGIGISSQMFFNVPPQFLEDPRNRYRSKFQ